MAKASTLNFDVSSFFDNAASQFRGLNPNEPGQWPALPKFAAFAAVIAAVVVGGWFLVSRGPPTSWNRRAAANPP